MKTKEELNALKEEVETVSRKLAELTEEELAEVVDGMNIGGVASIEGGLSGDENGMPCPVCNNGTWVVTVKK